MSQVAATVAFRSTPAAGSVASHYTRYQASIPRSSTRLFSGTTSQSPTSATEQSANTPTVVTVSPEQPLYVVTSEDFTDCYKRTDASCWVVGVYTDCRRAYLVAAKRTLEGVLEHAEPFPESWELEKKYEKLSAKAKAFVTRLNEEFGGGDYDDEDEDEDDAAEQDEEKEKEEDDDREAAYVKALGNLSLDTLKEVQRFLYMWLRYSPGQFSMHSSYDNACTVWEEATLDPDDRP